MKGHLDHLDRENFKDSSSNKTIDLLSNCKYPALRYSLSVMSGTTSILQGFPGSTCNKLNECREGGTTTGEKGQNGHAKDKHKRETMGIK